MSDIYAVFNELAVAPAYRQQKWTKYDANQWLEQFSRLLYQAEQKNITGLRTYAHPHEIELIEGYSLQTWFNDQQFSLDLRLRLQDIFTSLSRIQAFPENKQGDPLIEYQYDSQPAYGLGAAHLLDSVAISLHTGHQAWEPDLLALQITEIQEENGEWLEKSESVRHISNAAHLPGHADWIAARLRTSAPNGRVLLRKVKEWYPHLIFCKDAEIQLRQLAGGTPQFRRIVTRLFELEAYCQHWQSGGFEGHKIPNSSWESDSTMQQYGRSREFVCPDGQRRSFAYHLKGLPGHWRIHIWADVDAVFGKLEDADGKILVGYLGPHLPTATG